MVFTGIIQATCVGKFDTATQTLSVDINDPRNQPTFWCGVISGESVAFNGVCLTVLGAPADNDGHARFFLQRETLRCTTFGHHAAFSEEGSSKPAAATQPRSVDNDDDDDSTTVEITMNVERAMRHGGSLSGHVVLGHVHGVGRVSRVVKHSDGSWDLHVELPPCPENLREGLVRKGCISLDGVSLTLADVYTPEAQADAEPGASSASGSAVKGVASCRVALIPYTLQHTTLHLRQEGDPMNVEFAPALLAKAAASWQASAAVPDVQETNELVDERWMKEAIRVGENGRLTAPPNPWVGCVIASGGRMLAEGFHRRAGEPHAEVMAVASLLQSLQPELSGARALEVIAQWRAAADDSTQSDSLLAAVRESLANATVYCTLEPCHSHGRTPPCDNLLAIVKARRVVVALADPDATTDQQGLAYLRQVGVQVKVGVAAEAAARSLQPYLHQRRTGLPFVVLKVAQSIDGKIACEDGTSQWITGPAARLRAHRLRALSQAVLVGAETAIVDKPQLTVRHSAAELELSLPPEQLRGAPAAAADASAEARAQESQPPSPLRVVVDSRGRLADGPLLEDAREHPTLLFTTDQAPAQVLRMWADKYPAVEVAIVARDDAGHCDLRQVLRYLAARKGVLQLLVEGGATLLGSFLTQCPEALGLFSLFTGARLLGSSGLPWCNSVLASTIAESEQFRWQAVRAEVLAGGDTLTEFAPALKPEESGSPQATQGKRATASRLTPVPQVVEALAQGRMVIVMDDIDRENEADLIMAAQFATEAKVAQMVRLTSGVLCAPMPRDRAAALQLPLMTSLNEDPIGTAFTVSCDLKGTGTGISAASRAHSFNALADPATVASQLQRPGHVFPLVARDGLLRERGGHTEASVTLCKLAQLDPPVAVIGELCKDDGSMMRLEYTLDMAERRGFPVTTVEELRRYVFALPPDARSSTSSQASTDSNSNTSANNSNEAEPAVATLVHSPALPRASRPVLLADCLLPLHRDGKDLGMWRMCCYSAPSPSVHRSKANALVSAFSTANDEADERRVRVALIKGDLATETAADAGILVRVHSACFTSEVLGSQRCDCSAQLNVSLGRIAQEGRGVVLYELGHEGRGIGLVEKVKAYRLMESNTDLDTFLANHMLGHEEDVRDFRGTAEILSELGLSRGTVRLMTNNQEKADALIAAGLRVTIEPLVVEASSHAANYLEAKRRRGHTLSVSPPSSEHSSSSSSTTTLAASPEAVAAAVANAVGAAPKPQPHAPTFATPGKVPVTLARELPSARLGKLRVAVVRTQWNETLVEALTSGAIKSLVKSGVAKHNVQVVVVPGAYELPFTCRRIATQAAADVIIAIGVLIKGDTMHFEYISESVSRGLMDIQLQTGVPVVYGVLNCMTQQQAEERAGPESLLSASWADAGLAMAAINFTDFNTTYSSE